MNRHYDKPVHLSRLHDEILSAHPELQETMQVYGLREEGVELELPDETTEIVLASLDAIVAAHDVATPTEEEQEQAREETIRASLLDAITRLEQAGPGWPDLTPAQKDAAMHLAVRATAKLIRLQLRRLDAVE